MRPHLSSSMVQQPRGGRAARGSELQEHPRPLRKASHRRHSEDSRGLTSGVPVPLLPKTPEQGLPSPPGAPVEEVAGRGPRPAGAEGSHLVLAQLRSQPHQTPDTEEEAPTGLRLL